MSTFRLPAIFLMLLLLAACAAQSPEQGNAPLAPAASSADAMAAMGDLGSLWKGVECTAPEEALAHLDALLTGEPNNAPALALRGLLLSQQGQREAAFDSLTAAIRLTPTPQFYAWRALVLWRGGNARAASRDAQYALRKAPAQPVAVMVSGLLQLAQGQTSEGCAGLVSACEAGECSGLDSVRASGQCPR